MSNHTITTYFPGILRDLICLSARCTPLSPGRLLGLAPGLMHFRRGHRGIYAISPYGLRAPTQQLELAEPTMYYQRFLVLVSFVVVVTYADEILPTMPPLIQHFTRVESCTMKVYWETVVSSTVQYFNTTAGRMMPRTYKNAGTRTYCCKGWEDAVGKFETSTSVCSKQQPNSAPYITTEEYKDVLNEVADIRSFYEGFKALEALKEKATALFSRVRSQREKIYQVLTRLYSST